MLGLAVLFVIGVYLLVQLVFVPWLAYYMGRKGGLGRRGGVLCALLGFLVIAVPVWHEELPAIIVYNALKKDCGTIIHKPFEQWVQENPGVLETLSRNDKLSEMKREMGEQYPNRYIFHNGKQFRIVAELRSGGRQRIIWYENWTIPVPGVKENTDILYDLEKKEVLAEGKSVGYGPPWGVNWGQGPTWYRGHAKPGQRVYGYDVGTYYEFLVKKEKKL